MTTQIFTSLDSTAFRTLLADCVTAAVKTEVAQLVQPQEPVKQILTRKETAELLNISLPTLHDYTKQGIIQAYRLGYKVRYKREDVLQALNAINYKK
ncbi:helix-turn-helix domain-containing protein [Pedobacter sp. BS3]|uniref:helix-turn-helix domain-containing protein n=1 Tax=Pedobacter sp. BS3 TaxID=2567937 RepID=UPI0011EEF508|nr:helix-turn-helix domain-containing protein [Pedobacter sp. BS3]TZF83249.1 helix-turn-helix domain-containing protein [Pedobacter sp. BS3]